MKPSVALISMTEHGHVQRTLVVARELGAVGANVHFFTDSCYADAVRATGATFHDLFQQRSLALADDESIPVPCRYVTFAAHYAESLAAEFKALGVRLILHDSFAYIGVLVARILNLPRITLCAGHNMPPARTISQLRNDPRVRVAPRCHEAVELLRQKYGIDRASPFSYFDALSDQLNILSEPPEFLVDAERKPFAPYQFFGSIDRVFLERFRSLPSREHRSGSLRIYCSFGTVAARYYSTAMNGLLQGIRDAAEQLSSLEFMISAGRSESLSLLPGPSNITIQPFVDQAEELSRADIYLTHHGLNSTHESIYLCKPMLSYPFFADQPGLAQRCQELGLAVPITAELRGAVTAAQITDAITRIVDHHSAMQRSLRQARDWEINVVQARPVVIAQMFDLA